MLTANMFHNLFGKNYNVEYSTKDGSLRNITIKALRPQHAIMQAKLLIHENCRENFMVATLAK
jgi:hypothetical protein